MQTKCFQTKSDKAEWKIIHDNLKDLQVGDMITYTELSAILGRSFLADRVPWYKAVRQLEKTNGRTMENVKSTGYRVVAANEHEGLCLGRNKKARRQMHRAVEISQSTRRSELNLEEVKRIDALELRCRHQEQMMVDLQRRQRSTESLLALIQDQQVSDQQKIIDVQERIKQIEASSLESRLQRLEKLMEKSQEAA